MAKQFGLVHIPEKEIYQLLFIGALSFGIRLQNYAERNNLILLRQKEAGIQWVILLNGKRVTQYFYFGNNVFHFCVGTEYIDSPDVLLNRDYYIYFYVQYDEKSDSYLVINDFDGPFIKYPHGEEFIYGIDSFKLL